MKTVQSMLAEADAQVPRISPEEAKGLVGRRDVLFLDVREPAEVAASGKAAMSLIHRFAEAMPLSRWGSNKTNTRAARRPTRSCGSAIPFSATTAGPSAISTAAGQAQALPR